MPPASAPALDPGVDARYASARRQRLRPSFATQAGALWEKNLTAQKRNWRAGTSTHTARFLLFAPAFSLLSWRFTVVSVKPLCRPGECALKAWGAGGERGRETSCCRSPAPLLRVPPRRKTNLCLVMSPLAFSVVLAGALLYPRVALRSFLRPLCECLFPLSPLRCLHLSPPFTASAFYATNSLRLCRCYPAQIRRMTPLLTHLHSMPPVHFPLRLPPPSNPQAVIQLLVNAAFDSDLYRCGCLCAEYTSASGGPDRWLLSEAREEHSLPVPLHVTFPLPFSAPLVCCRRRFHCSCHVRLLRPRPG